jgi:hypothetical protein
MYRNTAGTLKVFAFNRTNNAPVTGGASQITCKVSLDGGARVALADTNPTEMEDGYYLFDVTAAENNGITADFFPESAVMNVQVIPVEHGRYLDSPAGSAGIGARLVQITVINSLALPIQSATVRVSRTGQTFAGQTNASGVVSFSLDDAAWTVSITSPGYLFTSASLVVNNNINQSYSMIDAGGVSPSLPGGVTGYWTCLSQMGVAESGVTVNIKVVDFSKRQSGIALDEAIRTGVSGTDGIVQFSNLTPGVTYEVWRGSSTKRYQILVPSTATSPYALGNIIGN